MNEIHLSFPRLILCLFAIIGVAMATAGCSPDSEMEKGDAPASPSSASSRESMKPAASPEGSSADGAEVPRFFDPTRADADANDLPKEPTEIELRPAETQDRDRYYEARQRAERAQNP